MGLPCAAGGRRGRLGKTTTQMAHSPRGRLPSMDNLWSCTRAAARAPLAGTAGQWGPEPVLSNLHPSSRARGSRSGAVRTSRHWVRGAPHGKVTAPTLPAIFPFISSKLSGLSSPPDDAQQIPRGEDADNFARCPVRALPRSALTPRPPCARALHQNKKTFLKKQSYRPRFAPN